MGVPNEYWSCTELNKDYEASTCTVKLVVLLCVLQLCETYSSTLFVPAKAEKSVVLGSTKFRSKGRLPVLSYYCQAKNVSEDI